MQLRNSIMLIMQSDAGKVCIVVITESKLLCLCRYMVQWPGVRILRRQELDAFLAQALSPKLYEPDQLQELKVTVKRHLIHS